MSQEQLVITLRKPVTLGEDSFSCLVLREPTGGEFLDITAVTGTTSDIVAVSRVAGVPQAVVRKIGAGHVLQGARWVGALISRLVDAFEFDAQVDTLDLELRKPVDFDGKTFTQLVLREPSAGELEVINKLTDFTRDLVAISLLTGIPRPAVDKMLAGDVLRGMKFINSFTQGGPTAGDS